MNHRFAWSAAALLLVGVAAFAVDPIESPSMPEEVNATRSAAEQKLDTPLRIQLAGRGSLSDAKTDDVTVTVEISGTISQALADAVEAARGTVIEQSPRWGSMRATLPLSSVLAIAARADVRRVRLPPRARLN